MDNLTVGIVGSILVIFLILLRIPIAIAMGLVALGGVTVMFSVHSAIGILKAVPYEMVGDWNLSAIPMFLLMGHIASSAGLTSGLFDAARVWLGRIPGGLASSTVVASAFFAAASGSSVASSAAFGRIAVPEMLKAKYDPGLATGSVAAAGTLGAMIPPSVLMIVFGIVMETSITQLFIAGLIPGLLSGFMFIACITISVLLKPGAAPADRTRYSLKEKLRILGDVWPLPVLVIAIIGGIFAGVFSATEAGAIGALVATVIAMARRALTWEIFLRSLRETAATTASLFFILVGASLFARFMALSTLPTAMAEAGSHIFTSPVQIVVAIAVAFIVLGMFLESISIMLLTLPILSPILAGADVNLIWFGILTVKLLEIGLVTPPIGMNIFVIHGALAGQVPLGEIFRGVFRFIVADIITLALLIAFPAIVLWLPAHMG